MYLHRTIGGESYPEIGARFGRDHTSVMHACRRIEDLRQNNEVLNAEVAGLIKAYCSMRVPMSKPEAPVSPETTWSL